MKPSITLCPSCLWLLALIAFSAPVTASAQDPSAKQVFTTVFLPTKVDGSKVTKSSEIRLQFDVETLPSKAEVTAARLVLVASKAAPSPQTINAHTLPPSGIVEGVLFGATTVGRKKSASGMRSQWFAGSESVSKIENYNKAGQKFALVLSTTAGPTGAEWHSNKASTLSQRPRLILEYTLDGGVPAVTETNGLPAVQSRSAFLPTVTPSTAASHRVPAQEVTVHSLSPAFFKDRVYVVAGNESQRHLSVLSPLGQTASPDIPLTDPGDYLAVSDTGLLYIVGNARIIVFDLNSDAPLKPKKNVQGKHLGIPNLNPEQTLTTGPDGSLYFVSSQQLYALNPGLKTLWDLKLTNKNTSRVTVGPSGKFLYLTVLNKGLVAVNAQTGERFDSISGEGQTLLKDPNNLTLHAPVVLQTSDGSERVYAGAVSKTGGVLTCFENPLTAEEPDGDGIVQAMISKDKPWLFKGQFSQPILAPGSVTAASDPDLSKRVQLYSVEVAGKQGTLNAIDWFTGIKTAAPGGGVGDSTFLLNGGNLVVDQEQSVFVWNGAPRQDSISGFNSSLTEILIKVDGLEPESQLFFGTDGTLYAGKKKAVLRAIIPQYTLDTESSATLSSPTHLRVVGTVAKNTTLSAPGSVLLGDGFTVKHGATFTVKQP
jgi:hypothetical protein